MGKDDFLKGEIMKRQNIKTSKQPRECLHLGHEEEKKGSKMAEGMLRGGEIKLCSHGVIESFTHSLIHLAKDFEPIQHSSYWYECWVGVQKCHRCDMQLRYVELTV